MLALVGCVLLLLAVIAAVTLDAEVDSQVVAANVESGGCLFSVFVAWADEDDVDAVDS